MKNVVLEPSTNTHTMSGDVVVIEKTEDLGGMVLEVNGKGIVLHGEHGVVVTDAKHIIKLVQQEVNPLTGMLQNSFD